MLPPTEGSTRVKNNRTHRPRPIRNNRRIRNNRAGTANVVGEEGTVTRKSSNGLKIFLIGICCLVCCAIIIVPIVIFCVILGKYSHKGRGSDPDIRISDGSFLDSLTITGIVNEGNVVSAEYSQSISMINVDHALSIILFDLSDVNGGDEIIVSITEERSQNLDSQLYRHSTEKPYKRDAMPAMAYNETIAYSTVSFDNAPYLKVRNYSLIDVNGTRLNFLNRKKTKTATHAIMLLDKTNSFAANIKELYVTIADDRDLMSNFYTFSHILYKKLKRSELLDLSGDQIIDFFKEGEILSPVAYQDTNSSTFRETDNSFKIRLILTVKYEDENGIDAGGLVRDFYQLFIKLCADKFKLFEGTDSHWNEDQTNMDKYLFAYGRFLSTTFSYKVLNTVLTQLQYKGVPFMTHFVLSSADLNPVYMLSVLKLLELRAEMSDEKLFENIDLVRKYLTPQNWIVSNLPAIRLDSRMDVDDGIYTVLVQQQNPNSDSDEEVEIPTNVTEKRIKFREMVVEHLNTHVLNLTLVDIFRAGFQPFLDYIQPLIDTKHYGVTEVMKYFYNEEKVTNILLVRVREICNGLPDYYRFEKLPLHVCRQFETYLETLQSRMDDSNGESERMSKEILKFWTGLTVISDAELLKISFKEGTSGELNLATASSCDFQLTLKYLDDVFEMTQEKFNSSLEYAVENGNAGGFQGEDARYLVSGIA